MRPQSSPVAVVIHSAAAIDPALREELEAWDHEQFGQIPYEWTPAEWYAEARIEVRLAGALEIVTRKVRVGTEAARVAGIGGVKTKPEFRLRSVASAMLSAAAELMRDRLDVEFGLLICQRRVAPVYEKAGWIRVSGPTHFAQPSGIITYPYDTMVLKLNVREWPDGPIDLCGNPW
jgi:GNAT superfamily N-acetyltransferase